MKEFLYKDETYKKVSKVKQFISVFFFPTVLLVIIWSVFLIEYYTSLTFWEYGLYPRKLSGLIGVIASPFIHGDLGHIVNNSFPLFVLVALLRFFYKGFSYKVILWIVILSGIWAWVFARPSYHIGASGLIYGIASFIFFGGIIIKETKHIAISLLIVFLYGSIVWGIFPVDYTKSWECHFTGFFAGLVMAYYYKKELKEKFMKKDIYDFEDEEEYDYENWKSINT